MAERVERDHIGIFGKMNAGKSSLMNLLTQQPTSIVDDTPGTTADTKISLLELHGLGPTKLFDTAGIDEEKELGEKKRSRAYKDLKECDLLLLVIDPESDDFSNERTLLEKARELDLQILIIYNLFNEQSAQHIPALEKEFNVLKYYKKLTLHANREEDRSLLLNFILENFESKHQVVELLPFLKRDAYYILIIPMDVETPAQRFLRPQSMLQEYITRNWAYPVCYRMDLEKARSTDTAVQEAEHKRFLTFLDHFKDRPEAMITDSQAVDVVSKWCPPDIQMTTFSIMMIHYSSRGRLREFAEGVQVLDELKGKGKILIAEACNHSRVGEDIGTVQIPNAIQHFYPDLKVEHNFGREFYENDTLKEYRLVIHCGGCMISSQKLAARLRDLSTLNIPYTNYGLFLSYIRGKQVLKKVLEPWGIEL